MAIDVKNIQVWAQRVIEFSIAYVKKHPVLTGVLSFLFLLYIFLRSLFIFLVVSIPIFIFIGVAFRLIFHIHQENLRTAKGDNYNHSRKLSPSRGGRNLDKRGNSYGHAQSVRRRSSKKYENHVHFQEGSDEKDMIFLIEDKDNNDLVDKAALVEENLKEIREVESKPGFGDGSGLMPNRYNRERFGLEGENSDEGEEEDEPEDRNKAVEWTEDDQKNLMDLGFSEMERNKRLESLIAKRKARKLLSLQVRRTLMNIGRGETNGEINSFLLPKLGAFPRTKSAEALISPTPGSAPSVLLPVHNPFDIPYDPQEEKPTLTGFFQEELVESHYNDAVFCRHESFSLGAISQGAKELDQTPDESSNRPNFIIRNKSREIPEFSRFKEQSGKDSLTELIETETSEESETIINTNNLHDPTRQCEVFDKAININTNKVDVDSKLNSDDIHESSSSSSSEIKAPFSAVNRDDIVKSLSFSARKNIPVAQLDTNIRRDEFFYHENPSPYDYKGMYVHTPSMSIASDLQVEVSEVGSQITNLSSDEESGMYDFEGNSRNEEVWVASPQLNSVDENKSRSGEVREVSEHDIMQVGFSRINQENRDISAENLGLPTLESAKLSTEESETELLNENNLENPKVPSNSVNNFDTDEKTIYGMNDQVKLVHDDQGIIEFIQHTYGEGNYTQPEENNSNSVEALQEKLSEPDHAAEELNFKGNNNTQVRDILAENGPSEASSSTSPRNTAEDKDPFITGVNDPKITPSSKKGQDEQVGTAKILTRPIKRVTLRGIKPKRIPAIPEETVSSSPSSTRKKFYLMANMNFDDIYEECQQTDMDTEQNANLAEDLRADQTQDGDSVGLQEPSFPLSRSTADTTINEGSGGVHELTSDNGADIGSQTSMEENEKTETIKGVEKIGELERSEDVESHSKLDNTIENSETDGVVESFSGNLAYEANINPYIVVAPTLNNETKPVDITQGNCTQPEKNKSKFYESLKGEVERQSEPKHDAGQLDFTEENNRIVGENEAENGSREASSATTPNSATDDKDSSILLEKPTEMLSSLNSVDDPKITFSANDGQDEQLGTAELVTVLDIDPKPKPIIPKMAFEHVNVGSSPSSTHLMANMSFDDVHILSQESNMEVEKDDNSLEDSTVHQTHAGDSVGFKEEDSTSYNMNHKSNNESSGGGLVQANENRADIGSQTAMNESKEHKTIKGVEEIRELERSEDVEGLSKLDNIDISKPAGVIESHNKNLAASEASNDSDIRVAPEKIDEI